MGRILYASVRFDDDKARKYAVPVMKIRKNKKENFEHFEPENVNDFDRKSYYHIKWDCPPGCEEDHKHYKYYKGLILQLGGK